MTRPAFLEPHDTFVRRHVSPSSEEVDAMLATLGLESLDGLVDETVPAGIRMAGELALGPERGERELLAELAYIAKKNVVRRSFLGLGYYGTIVPPVIQRNVLENPGWYTQYTPYQAEISQGRLEALLNFQTVVADLTGLPVANASMLDEATAAAEAMSLCVGAGRGKRTAFFASDRCHPQTLAVLSTRAEAIGIELEIGDVATADFEDGRFAGVLVQLPATDGELTDPRPVIERAQAARTLVVVATDLLALTLVASPGELGADVAVGSAQRFGVPFGYGGPHAAFLATKEAYKRQMPGRIIGLSKDRHGAPALRMALQTREQHIRRDKATSNICTAQVLLAIMASMYAVYHGPDGLVRIAERAHLSAVALAAAARQLGHEVLHEAFFDTVHLKVADPDAVLARANDRRINVRRTAEGIAIALDETVEARDLVDLFEVLGASDGRALLDAVGNAAQRSIPSELARTSAFLEHPVFHEHRSEHAMLRYLRRLEGRDLSLTTSMIPLGSCTMKLNGTSEMLPVTWPEFAHVHPFAPLDQTKGYQELFRRLEARLCEITGFHAISLQPNAGSQGEYAGLLVIRAWHASRGDRHRDVCLIPASAHGTNPASAVMAGMKVVAVACDDDGNIDVDDLRARAAEHRERLAALMVTYPSTHGVFEEEIRAICDAVHENGGQVYMDGANMNAQVGLCRPGDFGADVCHLNLHKTFCIPHGGGGPGMGPIGVAEHLAPFLPKHPLIETGGDQGVGAIAAAPWGSPSILTISWVYIELMGAAGLTHATKVAILNANYMAKRLEEHYPVLYRGARGRAAHEFIIDLRPFDELVSAEDVAKRLMDFGFHAPTMSFPVSGTLMIEPTESESKAELDRFCDALIAIRGEIAAIAEGRVDAADNPLKMAPHTASEVAGDDWPHPYSREQAAFPAPWVRANKFWPSVARVDNGYGDKNLVCTCPPVEAFASEPETEPSMA